MKHLFLIVTLFYCISCNKKEAADLLPSAKTSNASKSVKQKSADSTNNIAAKCAGLRNPASLYSGTLPWIYEFNYKTNGIFWTYNNNTNILFSTSGSDKEILWSTNLIYKLVLQTDGNLVLYKVFNSPPYVPSQTPIWSSATQGTGASCLAFQSDGNVVLYNNTSLTIPRWSTGTYYSNISYYNLTQVQHRLVLQDDGNLVYYEHIPYQQPGYQNYVWWASDTQYGNVSCHH